MEGEIGLHKSTCVKYPVERLNYSFAMRYYAYMVKGVHVQELTRFEEFVRMLEWDQATDEEMVAFDVNQTWNLAPLLKGRKPLNVSSCIR